MSLLSPALQAFIAVAKCKTVHGAADSLYLTQTAVTQRIRTLEIRLSTTLFIRSKRGMLLTPEGEALLRYCLAAQDLEGKTLAEINQAGADTEVSLSIMGPTSIMHSRVIPKCHDVLTRFPKLLMEYIISDTAHGNKYLKSAECQFTIIEQEALEPEFTYKPLKPEHYVLVCSSAWKKRTLKSILQKERIIDFNRYDKMTYHYLKKYQLYDFAKHDRHFVNRTDSLANMIAAGLGYGVLTHEFCEPYLNRGELIILNDGKVYENIMVLAWFERHEPSAYFTAIIDAIS